MEESFIIIEFIKEHRMDILKYLAIIIAVLFFYILFMDYWPEIKMMFNPATRGTAIQEIRDHGVVDAVLLIFLLYILTLIPGAPVAVVGVISGICFGKWFGIIINIIGLSAGNLGTAKIVSSFKGMSKKYKDNKYAQHFKNLKHPLLGLIIGYSIPIIPTYLVSFQANQDKERFTSKDVKIATVLGSVPISVIYSLGGDTILQGSFKKLMVLLAIIVIFALIVYFMVKRLVTDKL